MTDDDELEVLRRCLLRCTPEQSLEVMDDWLALLVIERTTEGRAMASFMETNRVLLDPDVPEVVKDAWLAMHRELGIRHVVAENVARLTFDAERWANWR